MQRWFLMLAAFAATAALAAGLASSAGAYGGGAAHDMWQIGISFNCTNPTPGFCDDFGGTGGFWGWGEFDRAGTHTWGDAQLTGCGHTVGGIGGPGGAGAGHFAIDVHSWYIGPNGNFWATAETDTFFGHGPPQSDVRPRERGHWDPGNAGPLQHDRPLWVLGAWACVPDPGRVPAREVAAFPFRFRSPWVSTGQPGESSTQTRPPDGPLVASQPSPQRPSDDDQPGHSTRTLRAGDTCPTHPQRRDSWPRDGRTVTRRSALAA